MGGPAAISWKIPPEVRGQTRHSEGQTPWGICRRRAFPLQGRATDRKARPYTHTDIHTTNHLGFVPAHTDTHTHTPVHTLGFVCTDMCNRMQVSPARLWFTAFGRPCYGSQAAPVTNQAFLPRAQLDPSITRPGITANRSRREECVW